MWLTQPKVFMGATMVDRERLIEARSILTRISRELPERRIPPMSGGNHAADYEQAGRVYARHEQTLFDVFNDLITSPSNRCP